MEWILVVIILLNGVQQTVEIKPMSGFWCPTMASKIINKQVEVDGSNVAILSATCVKK